MEIKPLESFVIWIEGRKNNEHVHLNKPVRQLEADYKVAIEALKYMIEIEIETEASGDCGSWDVLNSEPVKTAITVIEKAYGKSWEDIQRK